jgi:hypothetical protein
MSASPLEWQNDHQQYCQAWRIGSEFGQTMLEIFYLAEVLLLKISNFQ